MGKNLQKLLIFKTDFYKDLYKQVNFEDNACISIYSVKQAV